MPIQISFFYFEFGKESFSLSFVALPFNKNISWPEKSELVNQNFEDIPPITVTSHADTKDNDTLKMR